MQQTSQYELNQWDPEDRILREDFNADNAKIDAALAGKLGKMEIITTVKSDGSVTEGTSGHYYPFSWINWNDWDYFCILTHFPGAKVGDTGTASVVFFDLEGNPVFQSPMSMPGHLIVFLPRHDASSQVLGFIINDHLIPIAFDFSFREMRGMNLGVLSGPVTAPNITYFGGK